MIISVLITGLVQGIGFRPFVYRIAVERNLIGLVRNLANSSVEIIVQGDEKNVYSFLDELINNKPPLASYSNIVKKQINEEYSFTKFSIDYSSYGSSGLCNSVIPPDISICNQCIMEMSNPENHRYEYPFNSCSECGARYTIIKSLPYDRQRTTMSDFDLCDRCVSEYINPTNRRFNAETISCRHCGPELQLIDNKGVPLSTGDPLSLTARLLSEGSIVAIKGIGGFHISTSAIKSESIVRLRNGKHRDQKPFAVMSKNIEAIKTFAIVEAAEESLLTSYAKPVVILAKSDRYYLSPLISPHLRDIGVMLPYTGTHYLLLDNLVDSALIMTSANYNNEPIIKDNEIAINKLSKIVDYFLIHNREIVTRCDDSVVKINLGKPCLIRRSRGYVPSTISINKTCPRPILALGAELNLAFSIMSGNNVFTSHHIGDVEGLETYLSLKDSIKHVFNLFNISPQVIVCDLHPSMNTTKLAYMLADEHNWNLIQVQHHHAHIASLIAEHGIDEQIVGIACDGVGYGYDGKAWGGEVMICDGYHSERFGHLIEQPIVGSDLATFYPLRMVASILYKRVKDLQDYLSSFINQFPSGKKEIESIIEQISSGNMPSTTSTGRILDAVSALLDLCYIRSYEGEPAMVLESAAANGQDINIIPQIENDVLDTTFLLEFIYSNRNKFRTKDLAYSAHSYLARGLGEIAAHAATGKGIKTIGFSGGVAYNKIITKVLEEEVRRQGLKLVFHTRIPPGDGGISLGQAYVAHLSSLNESN
ncbi:MAG: carbamoyltransferase HypF [Nitrososphaeraceae archaeon]